MEAAKGGAAGNEDSEGNSATLLDDPCPGVDEDAAAVPVSGSPPVAAPRLHASSSSAANDLGAHASLDPGLRRLGADSEAAISAKGEVIVFDASAPASPSPPRTRHLATSDTDTEEARAGSSEDGEGNTPPPGAPLKPAGSAPVAGHPRHASSASASPPALTEGETIAPSVHAPRLTPTRRVTQDFVVDGFAISPEGDVITGALDIITPAVPENTATTAMGTGSAGRAANNDGDTTFDEYYSSPAPPRANAFDALGTAANAGSSASATSAADGGAQPSGPTVRTPCVTLGLPGLHEVATFNVASSCKVSVSEDMPLALSGEGTRPQVAFANEADSSEGAWADTVRDSCAQMQLKTAAAPNAGHHGSVPSASHLHVDGDLLEKSEAGMITDGDGEDIRSSATIWKEEKSSESESCFRNSEAGKEEKGLKDSESYYRMREMVLQLQIERAQKQLESEKKQHRESLLEMMQELSDQKVLLERKKEEAWVELQAEKLRCQQEVMEKTREMFEMENDLKRDALQQLEAEKQKNRDELRKMAEQMVVQRLAHDRQREEYYNTCNQELLNRDMELWENKEEELYKQEAAMLSREDHLSKQKRDAMAQLREHALKLRSEAADVLEADLESLKEPLIDPHPMIGLKEKGDNEWNKRQLVLGMPLVTGLFMLCQIHSYIPLEHRIGIMRTFTVVWVLGSVAFMSGLLGKHWFHKAFALYIGRLTFMCFAIFVIYGLYLLSFASLDTSSHPSLPCPGSSAPSPATPLSEMEGDSWFYFGVALFGLFGFFVSWAL